jgi:hypothetical protein
MGGTVLRCCGIAVLGVSDRVALDCGGEFWHPFRVRTGLKLSGGLRDSAYASFGVHAPTDRLPSSDPSGVRRKAGVSAHKPIGGRLAS